MGEIENRAAFRAWLEQNHATANECYVSLKRGRPKNDSHFWYIDAVEEALCFGWIDSTHRVIDGRRMQRFTPRRKGSNWTELNKARVRRLERLGLMTDAGRAVLPPSEPNGFEIDGSIKTELVNAGVWENFSALPELYQRVRVSNLMFYKKRLPEQYLKMLEHTIETAREGKTFGEWNDYGRLTAD